MVRKKNVIESVKENEIDFEALATAVGGEILDQMDVVNAWIDTGNLALNYLCSGRFLGGGIPCGKIVEIFGNSSSCKTLFGMNILYGTQRAGGIAVFLDAENTLNKEFASKASHLNTKHVLVLPAEKIPTLEKAFQKIYTVIKNIRTTYGPTRPICIVYDSIAVSPSDREYAETTLDENATAAQKKAAGAGADKPGERAKTSSKELRKLTPLLKKENVSIIFINQLRSKIGIQWGNPNTTAGGGRGLEYYASLRLETKARTKLKDKLENVIGMCVTVDNQKNKCFRPFIEARDMHLFFDKGINPVGGLLELLVKQGRIEKKANGQYKVGEAWANGQDGNFRASATRNDLDPGVLIRFPALIDGTSGEEVQNYLETFGLALAAVNADVATEEAVKEDEQDE